MDSAAHPRFAESRSLAPPVVVERVQHFVRDTLRSLGRAQMPTLSVLSQEDSNIHYDPTSLVVRLGLTTTKINATQMQFAQIWQVIVLVIRALLQGKQLTLRELYYRLVPLGLCPSTYTANRSLARVLQLLQSTRASVAIIPQARGSLAGLVEWKTHAGASWMDLSHVGPSGVQIARGDGSFRNKGARWILVVEKDAIFEQLVSARIFHSVPCILVTGHGYPPMTVRQLVRALERQLQLPVLILTDHNPDGVNIFLTYRFGARQSALESYLYATPAHWLGVHIEDVYTSQSEAKAWSPRDVALMQSVLGHPFARVSRSFQKQLEAMNIERKKHEIESCARDTASLLRFVRRKIVTKAWI